MSDNRVRVFDGKMIELDTKYAALDNATLKEIWYEKPNSKDTGKWTAQVSGTKLQYQCQPGDIDEIGDWNIHFHIEIDGYPFSGKTIVMPVDAIIEVS